MALEDLLERIAVALEKNAALQEEHLNFVVRTQQTGTISQTLTDHPGANNESIEKAEAKEKAEQKAKPEKEKPKYDFNKEIRQPFVELLNTTKNRRGPKDATQLTLTEVKYEEFLAAVKAQRSYVLDDERYAGFDKE